MTRSLLPADSAGVFLRRAVTGIAAAILVAYTVLLVVHPGPDFAAEYPEPVGNTHYRAFFPASRGAEPWELAINHVATPAKCEGRSAAHYREVNARRCRSLLMRVQSDLAASIEVPARCRYYYPSEDAAGLGTGVMFIFAAERCVSH